jgi:hypothetical protein
MGRCRSSSPLRTTSNACLAHRELPAENEGRPFRLGMNKGTAFLIGPGIEFWQRCDQVRRWRIILGVLAGAIAIWLLVATKPWVAAAEIRGKTDTRDYVRIYGWIAGAINLVLLAGLAAICPWWARKQTKPSPSTAKEPSTLVSAQPTSRTSRWFWPLVVAAMAATSLYSIPRMTHGFWDDEELNVRTTLWGKFKPNKKTGEIEFVRFDWLETIYGYSKGPNSHTLFGILSRACEDAWNLVARPTGFPLVEWPFRVPALVFGALAVAAFAWLLKDFGMPGTGVIAAFLLAIHPWNIRYASEARGYSLLIFLVPLLFVFWRRALVSGEWRWWAAFALAEFSLIYCYPGSAFVVVMLNLITVGLFVAGSECAEPRFTQAGRWFCVNVLATMLSLQMMLPLMPQGKRYFDFVSSQGFVAGWQWVSNTACFMLGGAPWTKSGEPLAGYPEWLARYVENPVLFVVAASFAIVLVLLGAGRLLLGGWASATFVIAMAICPPMTFVFAYFKKFLLYENYVIYSLPGVVVCAAAGVTLIARWLARLLGGRRTVAYAAVACVLLGYFLYTNRFRQWLVGNPLQQIRESVIYCRGTLDPAVGANNVRTASFCIPPYLYDAHMERLDSAGSFVAALRRADAEGIPLYLNIGMPWAARQYSPQMWELFNNRALFEEAVRLRGFEPSLDRLVARYKPGSAEKFDFSSYRIDER